MANDEKKIMELMNLISGGLDYIGYWEVNSKPKETTAEYITMNLLFDVRTFLYNQSKMWYKEKFPDAYEYDYGSIRKEDNNNNYYYSDDGHKYFLDDDMCVIKVKLYKNDTIVTLTPPVHLNKDLPYRKGKDHYNYYYLNEIDHFFTYCISNYLKKIGYRANKKEKGINAIKKKVNEYIGQQYR